MEALGDQYVMKYKQTRFGTQIGEHILKQKNVTFVAVEDARHIIMDKEMYYIRRSKGRSFYRLSGGFNRAMDFEVIKGQVRRHEVWTKKD